MSLGSEATFSVAMLGLLLARSGIFENDGEIRYFAFGYVLFGVAFRPFIERNARYITSTKRIARAMKIWRSVLCAVIAVQLYILLLR
jgi:hypothetical protein